MSSLDQARLGSTSPDLEPSSSFQSQYPLLDQANGEESHSSDARGRKHTTNATAELMQRMGVSPERRIKVTPEDDARVLRRIDLFVLPLMLAVYFLQGDTTSTTSNCCFYG